MQVILVESMTQDVAVMATFFNIAMITFLTLYFKDIGR